MKIGVLVSGSGTNLQAIIDAITEGSLEAQIVRVISNKTGIQALKRAEKAGIPYCTLSHKAFATREEFDAALATELLQAGTEWVVLAGFMRILGPAFLDKFPMRVINIHPSLLPAFPGVDAQAQALSYGVKVTGCTVHLVDVGMDTGPIIAQAAVQVFPNDSRDELAQRILRQEHKLLVYVLQQAAKGNLLISSSSKPKAAINLDGILV